jgi:hypothetical protein
MKGELKDLETEMDHLPGIFVIEIDNFVKNKKTEHIFVCTENCVIV